MRGIIERRRYLFQHTLQLVQNLIIPETKNSVSSALQIGGSPSIVGHLIDVLSAIGFNDQFGLQAYEIDYIRFDYHLASEFTSF